ncbi:hypothetical protein HMPREF9445_01287 [Bacteroides clarus YIT 12056]|uniref:Uncharacterized protein n=1 Tax=Bacteroides clarus YIT 12056 TaxID=762984 RepID=A0ABP2KTM5_9BACE|nr:hypothetical protein HMPREF9445_01287 [Bacteroides clarus YIT 12056]
MHLSVHSAFCILTSINKKAGKQVYVPADYLHIIIYKVNTRNQLVRSE